MIAATQMASASVQSAQRDRGLGTATDIDRTTATGAINAEAGALMTDMTILTMKITSDEGAKRTAGGGGRGTTIAMALMTVTDVLQETRLTIIRHRDDPAMTGRIDRTTQQNMVGLGHILMQTTTWDEAVHLLVVRHPPDKDSSVQCR